MQLLQEIMILLIKKKHFPFWKRHYDACFISIEDKVQLSDETKAFMERVFPMRYSNTTKSLSSKKVTCKANVKDWLRWSRMCLCVFPSYIKSMKFKCSFIFTIFSVLAYICHSTISHFNQRKSITSFECTCAEI